MPIAAHHSGVVAQQCLDAAVTLPLALAEYQAAKSCGSVKSRRLNVWRIQAGPDCPGDESEASPSVAIWRSPSCIFYNRNSGRATQYAPNFARVETEHAAVPFLNASSPAGSVSGWCGRGIRSLYPRRCSSL